MMFTRREFLLGSSAAGAVAALGDAVPVKMVTAPGLPGFAQALAYARSRIGGGVRVVWAPSDGCRFADGGASLLDAGSGADLLQLVDTGRPERGGWRLTARGICMEFMLRMELMGPQCSTAHPRPGEEWSPVLRVGGVLRLVRRMLAESRVEPRGVDFERKCDGEWLTRPGRRITPRFKVSGRDFVGGQRLGLAEAMADCSGKTVAEMLASPQFRRRLESELSLPG